MLITSQAAAATANARTHAVASRARRRIWTLIETSPSGSWPSMRAPPSRSRSTARRGASSRGPADAPRRCREAPGDGFGPRRHPGDVAGADNLWRRRSARARRCRHGGRAPGRWRTQRQDTHERHAPIRAAGDEIESVGRLLLTARDHLVRPPLRVARRLACGPRCFPRRSLAARQASAASRRSAIPSRIGDSGSSSSNSR